MKAEMLKEYLKANCEGRKNTVSGASLERTLRMSGNGLRRHVNRLRRKGVPIASSRDGYFYARTAGEVYTTILQLQAMVRGLEAAIHGLESALEQFGEPCGASDETRQSGPGGEEGGG